MGLGSITRGCGTRVAGGIYAEVGTSVDGMPIEHFIVDPPIPIDMEALGASAVGVALIERNGTTHVLDWIGASHYPNVADFVEEARRLGVSRRLPRTLDFSKIGPGSRLLMVHPRGHIRQWREYAELGVDHACPKAYAHHGRADMTEMCAGLWWHDLPGDPNTEVSVSMPAFQYAGRGRPLGRRTYTPAIVMTLPISNLAVIRDRADEDNEARAFRAACRSRLTVTTEDE